MEDQRTKNGAYQDESIIWHQHSNLLMVEILKYFKKDTTVIDLGCGHNFYCNVLRKFGYHTISFDGNILTDEVIEFDITSNELIEGVDEIINSPFERNHFIETNVICLEVGEHIPYEKSINLLNNITEIANKGDVLMSWAIPGQAGIGHINCQSNLWVIEQMEKRGYRLDEEKTASLRKILQRCHCSWFQNTIMYFNSK